MNRNLLPTDWAYLAGFIDGEGCISTHPGNGNKTIRGKWRPTLSLQQADSVSLLVIQERFAVGRFHTKQTRVKGAIHIQGRWVVRRPDEFEWLISGVLPYLGLKKRQAELALELVGGTTDQSKVVELSRLKSPNRVTSSDA